MIRKPLDWWFWPAIAALLTAALFGTKPALLLAIGLAAIQSLLALHRSRWTFAFGVQLRITYLALLVLGAWPPLGFVHWIQFAGTWTMVLTDYCLLARCLRLMPWNRPEPLSAAYVARTFLSAPRALA